MESKRTNGVPQPPPRVTGILATWTGTTYSLAVGSLLSGMFSREALASLLVPFYGLTVTGWLPLSLLEDCCSLGATLHCAETKEHQCLGAGAVGSQHSTGGVGTCSVIFSPLDGPVASFGQRQSFVFIACLPLEVLHEENGFLLRVSTPCPASPALLFCTKGAKWPASKGVQEKPTFLRSWKCVCWGCGSLKSRFSGKLELCGVWALKVPLPPSHPFSSLSVSWAVYEGEAEVGERQRTQLLGETVL